MLAPSLRAELTEAQKKAIFLEKHSGKSAAKSSSGSAKHSSSSSHKGSKSRSNSSSKSSRTKKKASSSGSSSSSFSSSRNKKSKSSNSSSQSKTKSYSKSHPPTSTAFTASTSPSSSGGASSHSGSAVAASTTLKLAAAFSSTDAASSTHSEPLASDESLSHAATSPLPHITPLPLPLPHGATPSAPITIEKSGMDTAEGLEPAATPIPSASGGGLWSRLFGSHRSYTYLSASTRAAIDRAPVRRGRWKYIVVHNSGTREGNARVFDIYHLRVRHMQNGLAYHFVIGDGHGSGDGQIEIGNRWTKQINGGHVASDYLNDIALGICLVGDFNRDHLTKAQLGALEELVSYLRDRVGKTQGRRAIVHAHKEINPRPTDCPGDHFPYSWLHAKFGNAQAGSNRHP